jgi:hypothetical protein
MDPCDRDLAPVQLCSRRRLCRRAVRKCVSFTLQTSRRHHVVAPKSISREGLRIQYHLDLFYFSAGNCVCAKNSFLGETTIQDPNTLQPVRVPLCRPCPDDRVEGGICSDRCQPGTGLFSFGTCLGCEPGLVAAGGDAVCALCPAGQVNNP